MFSNVKGFFKKNVKPIMVSMSIAMISVLSAISCFATDGTTTTFDLTSVLETSIAELKTELLAALAVVVPVSFAVLISYLGVKKAFAWIKGLMGKI